MEGGASGDTRYGYFRIDDANLDAGFPLKGGVTTPQFSVAFWMKARTGSSAFTGSAMFCKGAEAGAYAYSFSVGLYEPSGDGSGTLSLCLGTEDGRRQWVYDDGLAKVIQRNQWYHIAVTYQELTSTTGTLKVYVYDPSDDSVVTSTIASRNVPVHSGPLALGLLRWSSSRYNGLVDEMVVFNDVLTADEIDEIREGTYGSSGGGGSEEVGRIHMVSATGV